MLHVPVYLNSAADERTNSTFIAPVQSVLYTPGTGPKRSRATVVQRPPTSLYGEAAGILSPWVMPAFTYDVFTALGSSDPDAVAVHAALANNASPGISEYLFDGDRALSDNRLEDAIRQCRIIYKLKKRKQTPPYHDLGVPQRQFIK